MFTEMMMPHAYMRLSRRSALLGLTSAFTIGRVSLALAAAPTNKRFVVVILRGALDGMSAVVPYGDPDLANWRREILPGAVGSDGGVLDLGGFYGLHPAMTGLHEIYTAGELLPVHAVAGPYRVRSHFEAQDYLEYGSDHSLTSGWLNRVAAQLPANSGASHLALAVGNTVPILLRGNTLVGNFSPKGFSEPSPDLYGRIVAMHAHDVITGPALQNGLKERHFTDATVVADKQKGNRNAFPTLCGDAGKLLAAPDGPRLAALEIGGWDTHTAQKTRLSGPLKELDAGMVALKAGLGDAWKDTVVLVMTEFGRTVRVNGTGGTDHGTGSVAFVLGGSVRGGRVQANWPGLAPERLFENRDLQPTADLRSVAKGLLAQHYHLDATALAKVFPDSQSAPAMSGLIRT
jgi:uncharacterized protein (DUF1501 family)